MNKILSIIAAIFGIAILVIVFVAVNRPVNVNIPEQPMGSPGYDIYHSLDVHGAFTWGGRASTTAMQITSYTLTGSEMADYGYFDTMSQTGNLTYTLPATSTMMSILPDIGSTRKWLFHNATSSVITMTIAAGTGMDLIAVTANDDIIDAGEWAELTCTQIYYRNADNENIMCIISELANAD